MLKKHAIYQPQPGWPGYILRVLVAVGVMSAGLYAAMGESAWWLAATFSERMLRLVPLVLGGVALYFITLGLLGFRPRQFTRRAAD